MIGLERRGECTRNYGSACRQAASETQTRQRDRRTAPKRRDDALAVLVGSPRKLSINSAIRERPEGAEGGQRRRRAARIRGRVAQGVSPRPRRAGLSDAIAIDELLGDHLAQDLVRALADAH